MWRFALAIEDVPNCSRRLLLDQGVAEDWEFTERVNSVERGEVVFAVRQAVQASVNRRYD